MAEYDFNNLDDYEFEVLCRDLFNEEQRLITRTNNGLQQKKILNFKSFKRGKDSGIDLHYKDLEDEVVGQIKLSRGKFSDLYASLRRKIGGKTETEKVRAINPSKYIFMTSVPLSLENKKKIIELFDPYIISINDIYGREDLNNLIASFEHVERRHLKLYLNNPLVLDRLLNSATFKRSLFSISQIQEDIKYFVQTDNFINSITLLERNRLLMIKGLPGVGKTTLAKMISIYFAEKGYTFIEIMDLDNELERLIANEEKLVLYYDDFLGSNSLTIKEALRHESRLSNLLKRIIKSSDKFLILTTRINILANAQDNSEKLSQMFSSISNYEIDAAAFNYNEKKQILNKHIEKNELVHEIKDELVHEIINHKNFNPRLIEFMMSQIKFEENIDTKDFIVQSLNYPSEIWNFAYQKQINYNCKIYLNHLFLFGDYCEAKEFESSFKNRIKHEIRTNNYTANYNEFKECTSLMDNSFIKINNSHINLTKSTIEFINPSFIDFLIQEIIKNKDFIRNSVMSFDNLYILTNRINHNKRELEKLLTHLEVERLLLNMNSYKYMFDESSKMDYLIICTYYFTTEHINCFFSKEISALIEQNIDEDNIDEYVAFILKFYSVPKIKDHFEKNLERLISNLLYKTKFKETFDDIITLSENFNFDLKIYISDPSNNKLFYSTLKEIISEEIESRIVFCSDRLTTTVEVENYINEIKKEYEEYLKQLYSPEYFLENILDAQDWNSIIEHNNFKSSSN